MNIHEFEIAPTEKPIFLDTETCGLHGVPVLMQYAIGRGAINLYNLWLEEIDQTLDTIESFYYHEDGIVAFNAAFDTFQLNKFFNMLKKYVEMGGSRHITPLAVIEELAMVEADARDGVCLKPVHCCDLMIHARKGPYQSTMDRAPIYIRKVPTLLAEKLAIELNSRIKLKDIYFERSAKGQRFHTLPVFDAISGEELYEFRDVALIFNPSSALKALAVDALGLVDVAHFSDVELDKIHRPIEYGYAPFATAGVISDSGILLPTGHGNWRGTWPDKVERHISHWAFNEAARSYAEKDVFYLQELYDLFKNDKDIPLVMDDDDSVLAFMVGATRWKGFHVDINGLKDLRTEAKKKIKLAPTAPTQVKPYIYEVLSDVEKVCIDSTKATVLDELATWEDHPVAERAKAVIAARGAQKEVELYDKIIMAGRFHASFKVTGALSNRMSGADGLNAQGIKSTEVVRENFDLAEPNSNEQLDGGDFDGFELSIMDAAFPDPVLHKECTIGKIHAHWGHKYFFPEMTYDEIMKSQHQEPDYYLKCKQGVFAVCYFGEGFTLVSRVGIPQERAEEAYQRILEDHPDFTAERNKIIDKFCSMRQDGGIGTAVTWAEPADYVESMLGFRRYFTLENKICKALFDLAQEPPDEWAEVNVKLRRRDRLQTALGCVRSALYAAAFAIQASAMRAAGNHRIQSTGAQIAKHIECAVWKHQPIGIYEWMCRMINIHDELEAVVNKQISDAVAATVNAAVSSFKALIPLIGMKWKQKMSNWAEK